MYGLWTWNRNDRETGSWDLPRDATWRVRPGRNGVVLRAEAGVLHVTQAGDPDDHVLEAGEELRLPRGGLVVAFALAPARLAVSAAAPAGGRTARPALRSAAAAR